LNHLSLGQLFANFSIFAAISCGFAPFAAATPIKYVVIGAALRSVACAASRAASALEEDIIEADKIAESYAKVMVADFVVSLSRKTADKISGTGRWHVIKNRFGPDGLTFPSKMNMATAHINIYAENTVLGKEAKILMQNNDEVIRQALANKFSELNSLVK
jgi:hypothetical protein